MIPLNVYVALTAHANAVDHYSVELSVPHTETILASAQIAHSENGTPDITSADEGLFHDLSPDTREKLMLLLYRFCRDEMVQVSGTAIKRTFSDITRLLNAQFGPADCDSILLVLAPLTASSPEVTSHSIVRID